MTFFAILTLELPGRAVVTTARSLTCNEGATREGLYTRMFEETIAERGPMWSRANTTFFSVELNQLV